MANAPRVPDARNIVAPGWQCHGDGQRLELRNDARRKGEIYAKAAGVALGAPLGISEQGSPGPMPFRKMAAGMAAAAPVAQGEETLQVTVNVSWAIKQTGQ